MVTEVKTVGAYWLERCMRELSGVIEILCMLIWVAITGVYIYKKSMSLSFVNFTPCKLTLNKVLIKKKTA